MSAAAKAPRLDHPDARFHRKLVSIDDLIGTIRELIGPA